MRLGIRNRLKVSVWIAVKIEAGQIFIALNSYSQPEKHACFIENALNAGALAVISETDLGLANEWVCPRSPLFNG